MPISIYLVDAFTSGPFSGNPAAVCLLTAPVPDTWMQRVASEMNLSETAFLLPREDGHDLRWFTPKNEVDLCGHATLASAHILWETKVLSVEKSASFHTRSGVLSASRTGEWIELDFPTFLTEDIDAPEGLFAGLGIDSVPVVSSSQSNNLVVELNSEKDVRRLEPDFAILGQLKQCVIVTSPGEEPNVDFVSRFFACPDGVDEDPVTGSAHCVLGSFWQAKLGQSEFLAKQVSLRGGLLRVRVEGNRTHIAGQAVTFLRGELINDVVESFC